MNTRTLWSRILVIVGGIAMLIGAIEPLEGSFAILIGSGLVTYGTYLGRTDKKTLTYWIVVFVLIAIGVGVMVALTAIGGIGGSSGHSMWWGILVLPYPVGWIMGIFNLIVRIIKSIGRRNVPA